MLELTRMKTFLACLKQAVNFSEKTENIIYFHLGITEKRWQKIMRGKEDFPAALLPALCECLGNDMALRWLCYKRQYILTEIREVSINFLEKKLAHKEEIIARLENRLNQILMTLQGKYEN